MTDTSAISRTPLAEPRWGELRMAASGTLAHAWDSEDLRRMARRRLPRLIFDYVNGGGENEVTLRHNVAAFDRIGFRPRGVADIAGRTQSVSFFGRLSAAPFGICPMGGLGYVWPDADVVAARVAAKAGIPHVLASGASNSIEQVAAAAPDARRWFQLYVFRDPGLNRRLLERAAACGCEALVVTTDTQINAKRTRDFRNGFALPMRFTPRTVYDFATKPRWLWKVGRRHDSTGMGNLMSEVGPNPTAAKAVAFFRTERSRSVGWEELEVLRGLWKGPMLIKGIVTAEETERAKALGADGVIVSNHGGRNLDGTVTTIDALPEVVAAASGRLPVFLDSGIRKGSDVVKALALGARACFVGRPVAFALAVAGESGVEHVLAMIHDEIDRVQGLLGNLRLDQLDPSFVRLDAHP